MILYAIWSDKDCIFKQQQFLNSNINCNWFGTIWTLGNLHVCMLNARLCGSQVVAASTVVAYKHSKSYNYMLALKHVVDYTAPSYT